MESQIIEAAFEPLVATLRGGHFVVPTKGWSAEEVAAHIALNNELIASVAENIAAGGEPSYDNSVAVDVKHLRAYVQRFDSMDGLADAVERSAHRLATAARALNETTSTRLLPVRITDAGEVVRDGPIPIGEFIRGNTSFHLDIHLEQLKSLKS
jgi:hypothetical protein